MSELCPVCGAEVGPGNDAWLHFQEVHGGGASAQSQAGQQKGPPAARRARERPQALPVGQPPGSGSDGRGGGIWRQSVATAPATMTIIVLTIAVWLIHEAVLRSHIDTNTTLGGNGTLGDNNQWWRLITPVVVHFGAIHLIFNMLWLYQLGPAVERIMGRWLFVLSYLSTAVAGNVCSEIIYYHRPYFISGGASGAVYGVGGILVGAYAAARYLDKHRAGPLPPGGLQFNGEAVRSLAIFFGIYLLVGNAFHVDTAAHFGGGVMGLGIGAVLAWVRNGPRAASLGGPADRSPGPGR